MAESRYKYKIMNSRNITRLPFSIDVLFFSDFCNLY